MSDTVDLVEWLRAVAREAPVELTESERRMLASVLKGPLMKPVMQRLASKLEGLKDCLLGLDIGTDEGKAKWAAIQAESRGIIVVLESMWEMTHEGA